MMQNTTELPKTLWKPFLWHRNPQGWLIKTVSYKQSLKPQHCELHAADRRLLPAAPLPSASTANLLLLLPVAQQSSLKLLQQSTKS
jgi:hypothetical protein